ncbi:MAG: acyltransferase [Thermosynechococcaceae cyanobacterium]
MNQTSLPATRKKFDLLQSFRGLAALLVLFFHVSGSLKNKFHLTYSFNPCSTAWSGVDFFFVLSGFIIFYVHRFDINDRSKLKSFLIKRFIRLYPIYWLIFFGILLGHLAFPGLASNSNYDIIHLVNSLFLIPQDEIPFLGVSWTLSHEVFFYSIFGFLIFLRTEFSIILVIIIFFGTVLESMDLLDFISDKNTLIEFIFSPFNFEFILGCCTAFFVNRYRIKSPSKLCYFGLIIFAFAIIFNTIFRVIINGPHESRILAFGIPSAIIIAGSSSLEMHRNLKVPFVLKYLGDASYSLYLSHTSLVFPLTSIIFKLGLNINSYYYIVFVILAVFAVLVGCAIHHYIEKPTLAFFNKLLLSESIRTN